MAVIVVVGGIVAGQSRGSTSTPPAVNPSTSSIVTPSATTEGPSALPIFVNSSIQTPPGDGNPLVGRLALNGTCLVVDSVSTQFLVVWPDGYSATSDTTVVHLYDADGELVASSGQTIETTAAYSNRPPGLRGSCTPSQPDLVNEAYTIVNSPIRLRPNNTAAPSSADLTEAWLQGSWNVRITGGILPGGKQDFDTFRDIPMQVTLDQGQIVADDGCNTYQGTYSLTPGLEPTALGFTVHDLTALTDQSCERVPPLVQLLEETRMATRVQQRLLLHKEAIIMDLHR
jgi:hypothetical protein